LNIEILHWPTFLFGTVMLFINGFFWYYIGQKRGQKQQAKAESLYRPDNIPEALERLHKAARQLEDVTEPGSISFRFAEGIEMLIRALLEVPKNEKNKIDHYYTNKNDQIKNAFEKLEWLWMLLRGTGAKTETARVQRLSHPQSQPRSQRPAPSWAKTALPRRGEPTPMIRSNPNTQQMPPQNGGTQTYQGMYPQMPPQNGGTQTRQGMHPQMPPQNGGTQTRQGMYPQMPPQNGGTQTRQGMYPQMPPQNGGTQTPYQNLNPWFTPSQQSRSQQPIDTTQPMPAMLRPARPNGQRYMAELGLSYNNTDMATSYPPPRDGSFMIGQGKRVYTLHERNE
jgi:hypothetical protein